MAGRGGWSDAERARDDGPRGASDDEAEGERGEQANDGERRACTTTATRT